MTTLFIADLHLCVEEPAITAGFLHFLDNQAVGADALSEVSSTQAGVSVYPE